MRSLGDDFVAKLSEFVSGSVRELERSGAILIRIGRDQPEAALRGFEEETQITNSVDAGPGRECDHKTRAGRFWKCYQGIQL